ncbi:MAG: putative repeat protein (TIGR03833 family) [Thermoproteota archaeon]
MIIYYQIELTLNLKPAIFLNMEGTIRSNLKIGLKVSIVLKKDQRSGKLTEGYIIKLLTKSPNHPHGIKVRLENGDVGRVKLIHSDNSSSD